MEVGSDWRDLLLSILCWRRGDPPADPASFPNMSKDEWRCWAASQYRKAQASVHDVPFPNKDSRSHPPFWMMNEHHREISKAKVRLIAGALCNRAKQLGWVDLAQRWADTYWDMTSKVDPEKDLRSISDELAKMEFIERAPDATVH